MKITLDKKYIAYLKENYDTIIFGSQNDLN